MDNWKLLENASLLTELKEHSIRINKAEAEKIGIPQSVSITCTKPSGTVSQLVDSASGIHTRWAPYYIRTVRGDRKDPLTQLMMDQGVPYEPCVMKPNDTIVFSFPQKAPAGALTRNDLDAIQSLEAWKLVKQNWAEHSVSVTINVREDEWLKVAAWVWENFDILTGVSFLPYSDSDHVYKQAPYTECSKEEYEAFLKRMPSSMDWDKLSDYEKEDQTTSAQQYACTGNVCEMVNIGG